MPTRIFAALALGAAMPALAMAPTGLPAGTPTTIAPALAPAADFETSIGEIAGQIDSGDANGALARLDALLVGVDLPAQRGTVQGLRSFALARLGHIADARQAAEEAVAANPSPSPLLLRQLFLVRAFTGDVNGAADAVTLTAASFPRNVGDLPSEMLFQLFGSLKADDQRRFDLAYSLAAVDWDPRDGKIGDGDAVRLLVMNGLARRDRIDEVAPILAKVQDPAVLLRLGVDRRFASLWPEIERRLGPGARTASEAFVAAAKARYDKAPTSLLARQGYAQSLNIAAREPEAAAVLDGIAPTPADLAKLDSRQIWAVNLQADLLAHTGKADAGLARLRALNSSGGEGRPELISTMINEALMADAAGRPAVALAAADVAQANAKFASDFGKAFIANVRACALTAQGKAAEATTAAAPVLAQTENRNARLQTEICLARYDAAAATLIAMLGDAEDGQDVMFELQPFLIAARPDTPGEVQRAGLRKLKARPDVKAAFLKVARDLPAAVSPPR